MDAFQVALVLLLSFMSGLVGIIIGHAAKEELKTGRGYFLVSQHIILFAAFLYTAVMSSWLWRGIFLVSYVSSLFINKEIYSLMLLAFLASLAIGSDTRLLLIGSGIILYFLVSSALLYQYAMEKRDVSIAFFGKKIIPEYVLFALVFIVGYAIRIW